MRKILVVLVTFALAVGPLGVPAQPKVVTKTLGTDPAGDGPPSLDITYLKVGRLRDDLFIAIGIEKMFPVTGGYPELPGIQWAFDVKSRTFIAEAVAGRTPRFFLFEVTDEGFQQLESPEGGFDTMNGFIHMLVPLDTIGAKKGTRISGTGPKGTEDVDAHIHHPDGEVYPDKMATTKDFVVPRK